MIPSRVSNLLNLIRSRSSYRGDLNKKHFCVALYKGKMITPVVNNYKRSMVFGSLRGTLHAEMAALNYLSCTKRLYTKNQYVLPNKARAKTRKADQGQ